MLVTTMIFVILIAVMLLGIAGYLQTIIKLLTLLNEAKIAELKVFGGNHGTDSV